ncbi:MAG: GNAT family N-acetyltransferase [Rhodothermales bacterium]|nr:GNAT family N-acetyltransferase [Rhodothermales bacterium]
MTDVAPLTHTRGRFSVSTDPARLDVDAVHAYLTRSYWSPGVPRAVVERAVRGSLPFGLYDGDAQVGFARVITDAATFAYLADVYVLEAYQGRGLGGWLMDCVLAHPALQGLRRWLLTTQDAHAFYERLGFVRAPFPERFMTIDRPDLYRDAG